MAGTQLWQRRAKARREWRKLKLFVGRSEPLTNLKYTELYHRLFDQKGNKFVCDGEGTATDKLDDHSFYNILPDRRHRLHVRRRHDRAGLEQRGWPAPTRHIRSTVTEGLGRALSRLTQPVHRPWSPSGRRWGSEVPVSRPRSWPSAAARQSTAGSCSRLGEEYRPAPSTRGRRRPSTWQPWLKP